MDHEDVKGVGEVHVPTFVYLDLNFIPLAFQ